MHDLSITKGDTKPWTVRLRQGTEPYTGTVQTLRMAVKKEFSQPDTQAVFTREIGSGFTKSAHPGVWGLTVVPANTFALSEFRQVFVYDVQLVDGLNRVFTVERGNFIVNPDVVQTAP